MNLYQTILLTIVVPFWILTIVGKICLSREKKDFEKKNPKIPWRRTEWEKLFKWLKIVSIILAVITFFSFVEVK